MQPDPHGLETEVTYGSHAEASLDMVELHVPDSRAQLRRRARYKLTQYPACPVRNSSRSPHPTHLTPGAGGSLSLRPSAICWSGTTSLPTVVLAITMAKPFFPTESELTSLLLSLATYGGGLAMRPVGAIVLGLYADRVGRKAALCLAMVIMGLSPDRVDADLRDHRSSGAIAHRFGAALVPAPPKVNSTSYLRARSFSPIGRNSITRN
jgi:hypothetical protein